MNENTDRPALDTWPNVQREKVHRISVTIFLVMSTLPHFKIGCKITTKIAYMQIFLAYVKKKQ